MPPAPPPGFGIMTVDTVQHHVTLPAGWTAK
jgi:hypothetical protein